MLLLSVVLSRRCSRRCRCHRQTTNAAIVGRRHRRGHRRRLCRHNRIWCRLRRRPHLAAAFTAIVDAVVTATAATLPMQFPSAQPSQAIAIATATTVVAAVAVAFAAAIATTIALAFAVTITAASPNVSAAVVIVIVIIVIVVVIVVFVVVVDVVVIAAVASDLTAAYAAAIALASTVAAATALTAIAVFALQCLAPCASLFWLIIVFTPPLASSCRCHQPDLLLS